MKKNTDYHKPEMKTTNYNGTFYRFCNCDNCCEERGTSAGNLQEEWQDIWKCTLGVLVFSVFAYLVVPPPPESAFSEIGRFGLYIGAFLGGFWVIIVPLRIWDNTEFKYNRKIRKRNRKVNKRKRY